MVMKKSIFFWLYFCVSIILAIYFAVRIITSQMGRGPISSVQNIITYGTNTKDEEIIKPFSNFNSTTPFQKSQPTFRNFLGDTNTYF